MGISKRRLEKLAEKIGTEPEDMETGDFEGLTEDQTEDLAKAMITNDYVEENELTTHPHNEEIKADLGEETYRERLEGLKAELFEKFGTKKD